jgi:hypothetical protein
MNGSNQIYHPTSALAGVMQTVPKLTLTKKNCSPLSDPGALLSKKESHTKVDGIRGRNI